MCFFFFLFTKEPEFVNNESSCLSVCLFVYLLPISCQLRLALRYLYLGKGKDSSVTKEINMSGSVGSVISKAQNVVPVPISAKNWCPIEKSYMSLGKNELKFIEKFSSGLILQGDHLEVI